MIAIIKSVANLLCQDQVTVQELANALGKLTGGGEQGVPFKVQPNDPEIKDARIIRDAESGAISHVDMTPVHPFPMTDMVTAFGPYRETPRAPNPKHPPRVRFDVRPPGMAHSAAIFANYEEGAHDADDGTVIGLLIRRD